MILQTALWPAYHCHHLQLLTNNHTALLLFNENFDKGIHALQTRTMYYVTIPSGGTRGGVRSSNTV